MRLSLLILALFAIPVSHAQSPELHLRFGTAGPGVEVTMPITSRVGLRVSGYYLSVESVRDVARGPLSYRVSGVLATGTIGVAIEYRSLAHVSAVLGLWNFITGGKAQVEPLEDARLAGGVLDVQALGGLRLDSRFPERPSPYLGLAWRAWEHRRVGFIADLGAFYAGAPLFEAHGEGALLATSSWTRELEREFSSLRLYPHLSVGIAIRFDAPTR